MAAKKIQTDELTLSLISEVKKRKAEIAKLEKSNWLTNCSFSYTEDKLVDVVNIHVLSDVRKLISMAAFLLDKDQSYNSAATYLSVESPPKFTWNGFAVSDWVEDIKTRIAKCQISTKQAKLKQLEDRLNAIISPELKAQLELEAIASELA